MVGEDRIIEVPARVARCEGFARALHPAVELRLERGVVAVCPVCGRRFRAVEPGVRIDRAAWPRDG